MQKIRYFYLNADKSIDLPYNNKNLETLQSRRNTNKYTYTFDTNSDGEIDTHINCSKIQKIVFGKQWLEVTELGDYFCSYMFYNRIDISTTDVDFNGLKNVKTVVNYFANNMFTCCSNLKMNSIFNLPQNITKVGDGFALVMFINSFDLEMNTVFNLPKNITKVVGFFASYMFRFCSSLKMNKVFNLPENITEVGNNFASLMFMNCSGLEMNSIFNLPQKITTVGSNFAFEIFSNCKNLKNHSITIKNYNVSNQYNEFLKMNNNYIVTGGTINNNGTPTFDSGSNLMTIEWINN